MERVDLEHKEKELEKEIRELKISIERQKGTLRDLVEQSTQQLKETRETLNKEEITLKIKKKEYVQTISEKIKDIIS